MSGVQLYCGSVVILSEVACIPAQGDNRMNINGAEELGIATSRRHKPITRSQKPAYLHYTITHKGGRHEGTRRTELHTTDGMYKEECVGKI
jgi:hypothetical protein